MVRCRRTPHDAVDEDGGTAILVGGLLDCLDSTPPRHWPTVAIDLAPPCTRWGDQRPRGKRDTASVTGQPTPLSQTCLHGGASAAAVALPASDMQP
jgi:hypothetical protein